MPTIPTETAEKKFSERSQWRYPAGAYKMRIDEVRTDSFPDWADADSNNGFAHPDGEQLSVQFSTVEVLDADTSREEIGERKFFYRFTIRDGQHDTENIDPTDTDVDYWRLVRSSQELTKLARGLGVADESGGFVSTPDTFVDDLRNGKFDGQTVGVELWHREYQSNGEDHVDVRVDDFFEA